MGVRNENRGVNSQVCNYLLFRLEPESKDFAFFKSLDFNIIQF